MDAILQRIKQLRDQLSSQQEIVSPLAAPESPDNQYAIMNEKMRAVRGGMTPDQETVELMKRQQANGVYTGVGNPYLNGRQPDPEVQGVTAPPVTATPMPQRQAPVPSQKARPSIMRATATPTPMPNNTKEPTTWAEQKAYFAKKAEEGGYHKGAIVGQKALESERGESNFARFRKNFGGIAAYDSNPNAALKFKTIDEYWDYYDKMIQTNFPEAYAVRDDPKAYLKALKKGGKMGVYATDPDYEWKVTNTPEYRDHDY